MSEFYATIKGNRGAKTCGGSKDSGISATAQSWFGSVQVELFWNQYKEKVYSRITAGPDSTAYPSGKQVYFGPLEDLIGPNILDKSKREQ